MWLAKQVAPPPVAREDESAKSLPWRLSLHTSLQLTKHLISARCTNSKQGMYHILTGKHGCCAYHIMFIRFCTHSTSKYKTASALPLVSAQSTHHTSSWQAAQMINSQQTSQRSHYNRAQQTFPTNTKQSSIMLDAIESLACPGGVGSQANIMLQCHQGTWSTPISCFTCSSRLLYAKAWFCRSCLAPALSRTCKTP